MSRGLLVTGTDTGCGKTEAGLALMAALQARGLVVLGMKPVASGCERTPNGLRNADALRLAAQGSLAVAYDEVNPFAFEPAIAPHIAAAREGRTIEPAVITRAYQALAARADRVVAEGVGGWRVPLGGVGEVADLPALLGLPVVLVVGLRLGCINHALLTAESIVRRGAALAGWVGSLVEPDMAALGENLAALSCGIPAPCLGVLPWHPGATPEAMAAHLDLGPLPD
ncbi:MAG: dethiobiotin synthase [Chromatiales bacterium]|jgi:dethiobiotin synthetase